MKKIGILAFVDKKNGGVYQYTQAMIDSLHSDKTNKYIIFTNKTNSSLKFYDLEVRVVSKAKLNFLQKVVRLLQLFFLIRKNYFFSKKELKLFEDIDLFVSPIITPYPHFYINKPFIFTLHDMQERYFPEFFTKYQLLMRWVNNRALAKSSNKIICESNYVKNDIVKFTKIDPNKIYVIQSPPPKEFLDYKFDENYFYIVKEKYKLPDKYLFYPAQFWYHKNHLKLLEAFRLVNKKYKDIYLIFTGSKQNNYENVINKIVELNLENRVKHLGYIDYKDLPYLYKMSLMLVMPSLFESVSIPIYEAFALKVPVCCSNVVALPEQVGDAGLIFDPNDINDIANKIIMYLDDEELRKNKAQKGYERVKNFNHNKYREKLLEVLNG